MTLGETPFRFFAKCTECAWIETPDILRWTLSICPKCGADFIAVRGKWKYRDDGYWNVQTTYYEFVERQQPVTA